MMIGMAVRLIHKPFDGGPVARNSGYDRDHSIEFRLTVP